MLHRVRRLGAPRRNARFCLELSGIQRALRNRIHEISLRCNYQCSYIVSTVSSLRVVGNVSVCGVNKVDLRKKNV